MTPKQFLANFGMLADAPNGVAKLRELILQLAVQGRLALQDANDEPAADLLGRINDKRSELVKTGVIRCSPPIRAMALPDNTLPDGWVWARFGEITYNRDGERVPVRKSDREHQKKTYDYYGASGVIDKVADYIFDQPLLLIGEDGANLINRSTPIAFIAEGKYWVNNHAHVVDAISRDMLEYLRVHINAISLEPYITGMAQPKMNQARMNSIPIALPPLAEQRRIVAKVDELMALCDALEAQRAKRAAVRVAASASAIDKLLNARDDAAFAKHWRRLRDHFDRLYDTPKTVAQLRQAILQLAVQGKLVPQDPKDEPVSVLLEKVRATSNTLSSTKAACRAKQLPAIDRSELPFYSVPSCWAWVRLTDVCEVAGGITKSPRRRPATNAFPYLRVANVQRGRLELDEIAHLELFEGELERWRLERGDLLVVEGNGSEKEIGRCACWDGSIKDCVHQNHLIRCRPISPTSPAFLLRYLNSPLGMNEMKKRAITTSGLYSLSVGKIRSLVAPLPPLAEQRRIVAKVDQLMALCDALEEKLTRAEADGERLMSAAVHGLLDGKNPATARAS